MSCTADMAKRGIHGAYVLILMLLEAGLVGRVMADAARVSAETRALGSSDEAAIGRSTEAARGNISLLHRAMSIASLHPTQVLASFIVTLMIAYRFRILSPFPPLLRPPIPLSGL